MNRQPRYPRCFRPTRAVSVWSRCFQSAPAPAAGRPRLSMARTAARALGVWSGPPLKGARGAACLQAHRPAGCFPHPRWCRRVHPTPERRPRGAGGGCRRRQQQLRRRRRRLPQQQRWDQRVTRSWRRRSASARPTRWTEWGWACDRSLLSEPVGPEAKAGRLQPLRRCRPRGTPCWPEWRRWQWTK